MWLLAIGLLGMALKYLEIGPLAEISWWWMLIPFALAVVWWSWADNSGYTKRKVAEREEARVRARRDKHREALGLGPGGKAAPSRNPRLNRRDR